MGTVMQVQAQLSDPTVSPLHPTDSPLHPTARPGELWRGLVARVSILIQDAGKSSASNKSGNCI